MMINNPDSVAIAIYNNPEKLETYKHLSEEAQIVAVRADSRHIRFIRNPTEKVQLLVVNKNPDCIQYIKNPTVQTQTIALRRKPSVLQHIKKLSVEALDNNRNDIINHLLNEIHELHASNVVFLIKRMKEAGDTYDIATDFGAECKSIFSRLVLVFHASLKSNGSGGRRNMWRDIKQIFDLMKSMGIEFPGFKEVLEEYKAQVIGQIIWFYAEGTSEFMNSTCVDCIRILEHYGLNWPEINTIKHAVGMK